MFADLIDQLNPKHPLLQLAKQINWPVFDEAFSLLYSHLGKPAKHIRLMLRLSILKHMENLSDNANHGFLLNRMAVFTVSTILSLKNGAITCLAGSYPEHYQTVREN